MLSTVHPILAGLNSQQRAAVEGSFTQHTLVIAGAGSGKTKTSTQRMAYLIKEMGVSPYECMMLTFTNKAAREMIDRIAREIGETEARKITAGTFHSVCVRLLRRFKHLLGFDKNFTIYDETDSKSLIRDILKEIQGDTNKREVASVKEQISAWKNKLLTPSMVEQILTETPQPPTMRTAWRVYQRYQQRLKKNCAFDFDDLIMRMVQLLETEPEVREYCHKRYRWIQSDEHQDVNKAQDRLLELLTGPETNLWVVGDVDQSIYGWRGSDVRMIISFPQRFNAKVFNLDQNYRSTKTIVEAANGLIAHNPSPLPKHCFSEKEQGEPIIIYRAPDADTEARFIADEIRNLVLWQGYSYEDFAVLYRASWLSRRLEDALTQAQIPYQVVNGLAFYEHMVIKDSVALATMAYNPNDSIAVKRILGKLPGVGKRSIQEIDQLADQQDLSFNEASRLWASTGRPGKAKTALLQFWRDWDQTVVPALNGVITDVLKAAWKVVDYNAYVKKESESPEQLESNLNLLREFFRMAREWEVKPADNSLADFLENIALVSQADDKDDKAAVKLQTLHSSKGLEFPVVFIMGAEEGIFPSKNAVTVAEMEEERRLAYVGITRAERLCYLTHAVERPYFNDVLYNPRSRFIDEIPEAYRVEI